MQVDSKCRVVLLGNKQNLLVLTLSKNQVCTFFIGHFSVGGNIGYRPSAIYQTRTAYRSQRYPTLSSRMHSVVSQYDNVDPASYSTSPYKHKFDSVLDQNIDQSGQYSVPTQRASRAFDTNTDIEVKLYSCPMKF